MPMIASDDARKERAVAKQESEILQVLSTLRARVENVDSLLERLSTRLVQVLNPQDPQGSVGSNEKDSQVPLQQELHSISRLVMNQITQLESILERLAL